MPKKTHVQFAKFLTFILGIVILYYVSQDVSWHDLIRMFRQTGWLLILPIMVYPVMMFFHALDTQSLLPQNKTSRGTLTQLFFIRLVGDSINKITPFLDVGGEPLKVILMIRHSAVHLKDAVIAVVISRVGFVLSEIIVIALAWAAMIYFFPYPEINLLIFTSLIMSAVYLGISIFAQMNGAVKIIPRISRALHTDLHKHIWIDIDLALKEYYLKHSPRFLKSTLWQLTAWIIGGFEVFLFFRVLGLDMTLLQAFVLQSLLQSIKTVSFMIPGNIGVQEGGLGILCVHLGFSMTDGFALSIIKRFRQLVWFIVGLILWKTLFKEKSNPDHTPTTT